MSEMSSAARVFEKAPDVVDRRIADETLLIPIRGRLADMQRIFALNPVCEFIWGALEGGSTPERIAEQVTEAFDVDSVEAERDCREFLAQLVTEGLVREVNDQECDADAVSE